MSFNHILESAKAAVATVGVVLTAVNAAVADGDLSLGEPHGIVQLVLVVLTALGVWAVPNKDQA